MNRIFVKDWKDRYIHPDYYKALEPNATLQQAYKKIRIILVYLLLIFQPCPDVFWFPMVTDAFTTDLVNLMEIFNKWSGSSHNVS